MQEEKKQENVQGKDVAETTPKTETAKPASESKAATSSNTSKPSDRPTDRRGGGDRGRGDRNQRGRGGRRGPGGRGRGRRGPKPDVPAEADYEEKNIEIARVTRVTKGGKRMRFRALTVIGNRKGRVGFGLAKGTDVAGATSKATAQARKSLLSVPLHNQTIPHQVIAKFGGAQVLLKPAPAGTGIKAGGAVRTVLELAGIPNVVSKILGSNNKTNNVKATFVALKQLRLPKGATSKEAAEKSASTKDKKAVKAA